MKKLYKFVYKNITILILIPLVLFGIGIACGGLFSDNYNTFATVSLCSGLISIILLAVIYILYEKSYFCW